jgi:hypothetical protein
VTCPADAFEPNTTECRASADICDVAENCTGSSANCPADGFQSATTICRTAAGDCDVAESCTGTGAACPNDDKSTAECRASAGACDIAESCDGVNDDCPADAVEPNTTECRADAGDCDQPENCDGTNVTCPADGFEPATTGCGDTSNTDCTNPDTCDGNGLCLSNHESNGFACGDSSNTDCTNPDTCDGSGTCLDNHEVSGFNCPDDGEVCTTDECDGAGACTHPAGNAGTQCRADAGECDVAETCDGSNPTCPANGFEPSGASCGDGSNTDCTNPDTCDGSGACQSNHEAISSPCNDGNACTSADGCDGAGACDGGPPTICAPCEFCDNIGGCTPAIDLACEPGAVDKSLLRISNNTTDNTKDRLVFKFKGQNAIDKSHFGNPTNNAPYQLCIYDDKVSPGLPETLVYSLTAPAGGTCAGDPCWKDLSTGYKYKDNDLTPDGVQKVLLKAGSAGKGRILFKAKGSDLGLVPHNTGVFFSQSDNVTVVVAADNAPKCFKATFPRPWLKNLVTSYKDKN